MQFLMLVCRELAGSDHVPSEADKQNAPDVEAWWHATNDAGKYVMGDRLRPPAEAVSVRVRGGETLLSEGPFAEGGECVMGFDILECANLEEAIEVAKGHGMAHGGFIEVRALWPFDQE